MTTLNSIHLQIILHYITLTNYYIIKDTQVTSNHCNVNAEIEKTIELNKLTTLNSIDLQIILHYITLTNYYIVKDSLT